MAVNLNISRKRFSPTLFSLLRDYTHRIEFYKGSAGSGKSVFVTQKIIIRCLSEPIRVLVCRRYASTIRQSCFALFKEVLRDWQLTRYVKINEGDFRIIFPNGSEIIFTGLDDEAKLLSLTNISTIFVEEITEVPQEMFEQLNLRMRGVADNQQILACFNPINKNHWLYNFCVEAPPDNFLLSETTYKDNPFLSAEYIKTIDDLKDRNPQKYRVYGLGEWGIDDEGLVFTDWEVTPFNVQEIANGLEHRCGCDFGYIDPSVVIASLYDKRNHIIYVYNEWAKTGCQIDEVAAAIKDMGLQKSLLYCDSAEPRSIEFLRRHEINAKPCLKGADSVKARLLFLQNNKIIVHPDCKFFQNEISNFSYIKDTTTGKYTEHTTHEFSHSLDALGYAYSDIYHNNKLRTLDKSVLGL